jgi:hypothetical protein
MRSARVRQGGVRSAVGLDVLASVVPPKGGARHTVEEKFVRHGIALNGPNGLFRLGRPDGGGADARDNRRKVERWSSFGHAGKSAWITQIVRRRSATGAESDHEHG